MLYRLYEGAAIAGAAGATADGSSGAGACVFFANVAVADKAMPALRLSTKPIQFRVMIPLFLEVIMRCVPNFCHGVIIWQEKVKKKAACRKKHRLSRCGIRSICFAE
jgi:hypothetical protein